MLALNVGFIKYIIKSIYENKPLLLAKKELIKTII